MYQLQIYPNALSSPALRQGTLMGDQVQAAAAEGSGLEWTWSKRSDVTAARWRMALSSGAGVLRSGWARTAQPGLRDAVGLQGHGDGARGIDVLGRQHLRQGFDERHHRTEARVDLGELHADRPAPQDQQRRRHAAFVPDGLLVRPEAARLQARHWGAVGSEPVVRTIRPASKIVPSASSTRCSPVSLASCMKTRAPSSS